MPELTQFGEEFIVRKCFIEDLGTITGVEVGLYDSATDSLGDTSDVGDITSEPTDGNYDRLTFDFGSTDFSALLDSGDVTGFLADHSFDVTDTTGDVDSYFIVVEFQSTVVNSEAGQNKHLIGFGDLEQSYPLGSLDQLDSQDAGIKVA